MKARCRNLLVLAGVVVAALSWAWGCDTNSKHMFFPSIMDTEISPDGQRVACGFLPSTGGVRMAIVELSSGDATLITGPRGDYDRPIQWSNTNNELLFARCTATSRTSVSRLMTLTMPEAIPTALRTPNGLQIGNARWLGATGDIVAMVEGGNGQDAGICRLERSGSAWRMAEPIVANEAGGEWAGLWVTTTKTGYRIVAKEEQRRNDDITTRLWTREGLAGRRKLLGEFGKCFGADLSSNGDRFAVIEPSDAERDFERKLHLLDTRATSQAEAGTVRLEADFVSWSPDGSRLLAWKHGRFLGPLTSEPGNLVLVYPGGLVIKEVPGGPWSPTSCAWLPDGKRIVIGAEHALWIVDVETGLRREVWRIPPRYKRQD